MFSYLEYTEVEGTDKSHDIEVYALSTCGFCKKAFAFLKANNIAYRYVYVDDIPLETKNLAKAELVLKFRREVSFPFAIIDSDSYLIGFIEVDWKHTLLKSGGK